ncbi:GAF domain-containing protein [Corynebacterium oculi]|uniref:GAF domain-containing protein n=1 Tax=Corynebacterium oculi TaxID=1544416 RepID=UPI001FE163EA|nr:GAF domain-containing protein [Corynebacterium oculi]
MTESWFLVDTVGDSPSVLRIGARSKQWRPLSNKFRGSVRTTVLRLLETVLNNLKQSQVLVDLAGPGLAVAFPVLGVTRHVHGVLMWIGDPTYSLPREPETEAWGWDLSDRAVPSAVVKAKTPFSPGETLTDWLSRFPGQPIFCVWLNKSAQHKREQDIAGSISINTSASISTQCDA